MSVKSIVRVKYYSWNHSIYICENSRYLINSVDNSVTLCDEIMYATDSVSTNVTNTVPTDITNTISINVTSNVSINSDDSKVRYKMDCYIFHNFLLVIILLITIALIWYHYTK